MFILGPISPCVDNAGVGYTCANGGTAAGVERRLRQFRHHHGGRHAGSPIASGGNFESGSAMVIANSVAGGFFNAGPSTCNGTIATATISGNGDIGATSSGTVFSPVFADRSVPIGDGDPGHGARSGLVRPGSQHGRFGGWRQTAMPSSITARISAASRPTWISARWPWRSRDHRRPITPASAARRLPARACRQRRERSRPRGGLLNTGTIRAQAITKENTTSNITSEALFIGAFTTVPRLDVAGEFVSGTTFTSGTITAVVQVRAAASPPPCRSATRPSCRRSTCCSMAPSTPRSQTSTISPDAINAHRGSPFTQSATAILDQSGSVG